MSERAIGEKIYMGGISGRYVGWGRILYWWKDRDKYTLAAMTVKISRVPIWENCDYPSPPNSLVWEVYKNGGRMP